MFRLKIPLLIVFLACGVANPLAYSQSDSGETPVQGSASPYNLRVETEPRQPQPGVETTFIVVGEFPSTGYAIQNPRVALTKSIPEQIVISMDVVEPTGPELTVITPFYEKVGSAALTKGFHPISVWINGEQAYESTLGVGVEESNLLIGFDQVSGFANRATRCNIFKDGQVIFTYEPPQDFITDGLAVKPETFAKLQSQVQEIDFAALKDEYSADPPVMDGFVYIVRHGDKKIAINQAAELPESLQNLLETLVGILNRQEIIEPEVVPPAPMYNLRLEWVPAAPKEGESMTLILSGEFPTPGYVITKKQIDILKSNPEQVSITLEVKIPVDPQDDVITPFKEEIGTVTLSNGIHPAYVFVNGDVVYKTEIMVGVVEESKILSFDRSGGFAGWFSKYVLFESGLVRYTYDPERGLYAAEGMLESETFKTLLSLLEKTDFSVFQKEYLPETPYADGYDYQLYCKETQIHIGQGATLPESLQAIFDILESIMNHQNVVDIPIYPPVNAYNLRLEYEPQNALAYEPVTLYVSGEFPTPGYTFTKKEIAVLESYPEQISLTLEVQAPDGPQNTVIAPFREEIGTVKLSAGEHPVRCTLNGNPMKMDSIVVGNVMDPYPTGIWVGFTRSGGLAGMQTMMMVFENGAVRIRPNKPATSVEYGGFVSEETFNQLQRALANVDFSTLQPSYEPEQIIYDGFNYEIVYQGSRVLISQGAKLPQELSDLFDVLNQILDESPAYDSNLLTFERSGGFTGWTSKYKLYENGLVDYTYDPDQGTYAAQAKVVPETFEQLCELLAQTDFSAFSKEYLPETPYADGYDYQLYYQGSLYHIGQGATLPESLQAIFDILDSIMNHQNVVDRTVVPVTNTYGLYLEYEPIIPVANEPVTLFVSGTFPTQGYSIVSKDVSGLNSDPNKLWISLEFKAPDERHMAEPTPFLVEVGTVTLREGFFTVQCAADGEYVDLGSFYVTGDKNDIYMTETWLGFIRSGGIAGLKHVMMLQENRELRIRPNYPVGSAEYSGYVLQATFNKLQEALAKIDFSILQSSYKPEQTIYDGFNYEIDYQGNRVIVAQGAELSQELSDLVDVLISILDGQWNVDRDATTPGGEATAVQDWAMY